MRIVSNDEMRQIEKSANEHGMSYYEMMENAGTKVAEYIKENTKKFETKLILICVGSGNNGGDGFVAARKIKEMGGSCLIMLAGGMPKTDDAKTNFKLAQDNGIEIVMYEPNISNSIIYGCEIFVDCVYGTGFHGELKEDIKKLFEVVDECDTVKFSVDIPSGISGDGVAADGAFKADYTIAIDSLKHAHISEAALEHCGKITCVDIGIPEECHNL